jgi:BlaI family transcriptional regulator, penicillinase repressor
MSCPQRINTLMKTMPRKPSEIFTDKELEIMRVVWELGEATAREIQARLSGMRHYNSVLTIIRVLEKKGHLAHREDGKTYIYSATESQEKSRKSVLGYLVKQVFGGSAASLVLNLVETGDLTNNDLEEIRKQIAATPKKAAKKRGKK